MTILYQYPPTPTPPAPVGGATEAKQDAQIALATTLNTQVSKEAKQDTQITLATTLNAKDFATSAKQDTAQASLGSIDTKLTSQATAAKQDLLLAELQLKADLTETQPVSLASIPLATGASTAANQATEIASLSSIDTKLTSQATAANQTAQSTLFGALTETAPASDTASSGLNGRLQRIAQRITSLIALLPASLGQKTMANSLAVTLASDQAALSVRQLAPAVTAKQATVTAGAAAIRCTTDAAAPSSTRQVLRVFVDPDTVTSEAKFYIGSSTVTTTGANKGEQIYPGAAWVRENDANDWYIISTQAAQPVAIVEAE